MLYTKYLCISCAGNSFLVFFLNIVEELYNQLINLLSFKFKLNML